MVRRSLDRFRTKCLDPLAVPDIPPATPSAVLFRYTWNAGTVTLEERLDVEAEPPSDDGDLASFAGFWCELRDVSNTALWRGARRHPALGGVEDLLEDPNQGYGGRPDDGTPITFRCLVPADVAGAATVAIIATDPFDPTGAPAVDLVVHSFA
jgi:hypothetical protein